MKTTSKKVSSNLVKQINDSIEKKPKNEGARELELDILGVLKEKSSTASIEVSLYVLTKIAVDISVAILGKSDKTQNFLTNLIAMVIAGAKDGANNE